MLHGRLWPIVLIALVSSAAQAGPVLYVDDDAPPGGDGAGWRTAYRFLADALTAASGGGIGEIRVGQGTYQPDRDELNPLGTGNRQVTFQLINGVALMGGYAGFGAPDPDARNIELYETILSGDLLSNDDPDQFPGGPTFEENCYHVVTGSGTDETAVLDGFSITAGNDDRPFPGGRGGGMYNYRGSPTVSNNLFAANVSAFDGGAMANLGGSPVISHCAFDGNHSAYGGGMVNDDGSNPLVTACTFKNNTAEIGGGGMYNENNSSPTTVLCIFSANSALGSGPFSGGGAVHTDYRSNPIFTDCSFVDNLAKVGGAMANRDGAGLGAPNPTILSCTFSGNAGESAGGLYSDTGAAPALKNSIVWSNTGGEILDVGSAVTTVRYSNIQGGWKGIGNIDADPMFVDPVNGDYHLASGSRCIDAGNNWGVPIDADDYDQDGNTAELFPVDLDGNPRFNADEADFDPGCGVPVVVDMGAYEYQFDPVEEVIFADLNGDGTVGILDLLGVLAAWGDAGTNCLADLDIDGAVGIFDLLALLSNWG